MARPMTVSILSLLVVSAKTAAAGCTTTVTITQPHLPTPPYWPQCSWDGTLRIYPSTATVARTVDCHGCDAVEVRVTPVVHCPAMVIKATATEATATTLHRTVCSASS
ncbi:Uncharacterized protein TPAR_05070 [Tolypocladium paradoxum]|uniref:Uncharacterized protein n=1 Tax=Tolypocladium paradoxum TaxID=94208 RepID=A0A2S4KX33_9HYPO|nr:Uncharacterized protein TPAR_05070 [Tolypocladium paradoxum]